VEVRTTHRLVAVAGVLIATLASATPGLAKTTKPKRQTATAPITSGGSLSATITYTPKSYYDAGLHLTITRAGRSLYSQAVTSPGQCGTTCSVAGAKALAATDLEQNGEPVVRLDLYTGGAHCCYLTQFYTYDPGTETYRRYEYDWGDPGYALKRLGGKYVFQTNDDRFPYTFTDYAASGAPLELFSFNGTKLVNVTRQYPSLIAKDAASYLKAYRSQSSDRFSDSVGVIAAWAADEDELGHSAQVASYLKAQAAAGHLNSAEPGTPGGARFIKRLNAFLKKAGYLT
jgi:hypothetical protein